MKLTIGLSLLASLAILALMLSTGSRRVLVDFGNMVEIHAVHFHFKLSFIFDRLSVPMVVLSLVLCGTVGSFGLNYLHRDLGFHRFFMSFAMFTAGMTFASLAGTIETLFLGWELVGLSSSLLIAYFHERKAPVEMDYCLGDLSFSGRSFLAAAIILHHQSGEGDFSILMGNEPWPAGVASLTDGTALLVGTFLLIAAAGKVGARSVFWVVASGNGRTNAFERDLLRCSIRASRSLSSIASQSDLGSVLDAQQYGYRAWRCFSRLCFACGTGTNRYQERPRIRVSHAVSIIVVEIGCGFRYLRSFT